MRKTIADALEDITGVDNGTDADAWIDWYKNRKRAEDGLPPKSGRGGGRRTRVFQTDTYSDRFVFLVDTSTSMTEKIKPEVKEEEIHYQQPGSRERPAPSAGLVEDQQQARPRPRGVDSQP